MKDAKGHGSDAHQAGVEAATKPVSPHEGRAGKFQQTGTGSLPGQGLTPAKRAGGTDVTGALRVAWGHAQLTNEPQTITHTGRGGLTMIRKGDSLPYGQSHMVVHPDGTVRKYHPV